MFDNAEVLLGEHEGGNTSSLAALLMLFVSRIDENLESLDGIKKNTKRGKENDMMRKRRKRRQLDEPREKCQRVTKSSCFVDDDLSKIIAARRLRTAGSK